MELLNQLIEEVSNFEKPTDTPNIERRRLA
jgi:hypothetical protein